MHFQVVDLLSPRAWGLVAAFLGSSICAPTQGQELGSPAARPLHQNFPGERSDWHGFGRFEFNIDETPVSIVTPRVAAPGNPWVWHGEFFGHKPAPDIELLKRGFHIFYARLPDLLGGPPAVKAWNQCYSKLTTEYGLAPKVALVGLSRGGLYCYNWAAQNPEKVACIYGDAPVCDLKSWPGGKGAGKGSPKDWQLAMKVYAFANEQEALDFRGNPIDQLEPLARSGVTLLHVYGDADDVVPWQENTQVVSRRYTALGGSIVLIGKSGVGHHPHGLDDATPIVEFIERHSLKQFSRSEPIRIACLGDSITAGARVQASTESYPARLQQELGAGYAVKNFGLGGATLIRSGSPNVWDKKLGEVLAFQPHQVIISLGTNDTVSGKRGNWERINTFEDDYRDLLIQLSKVPELQHIYLCTPTDMVLETPGLSPARIEDLTLRRPRLRQLCVQIQSLAEDSEVEQVQLLELNDVLAGHPEWLTQADGVHPNPAGYRTIATRIADAVLANQETNAPK